MVDAGPGNCTMSAIATMVNRINVQMPFFGVVYFWANWYGASLLVFAPLLCALRLAVLVFDASSFVSHGVTLGCSLQCFCWARSLSRFASHRRMSTRTPRGVRSCTPRMMYREKDKEVTVCEKGLLSKRV